MAARISLSQAKAMAQSSQKIRDALLDPLIRSDMGGRIAQKREAQDGSTKLKKSTAHRTPKVAKRVSTGTGPEGTGAVLRDAFGQPVSLTLHLHLLPVPKERARVVQLPNKKTVSFTPARTKRFTNDVKDVLNSVMGSTPPLEGPVRLDMTFYMDIPAGWPKWKKEAACAQLLAPTARPDMDNLEKALLDALNERAFIDDAYVVERMARKVFSMTPGIEISVVRLLDRVASNQPRAMLNTIIDKDIVT